MQALTVVPGKSDTLTLTSIPEPEPEEGAVLVESLAVGLCGTDAEIVRGDYGEAPPGRDELVIGHENLGRVIDAPTGSAVQTGDLVVGIVRRPDPEPCAACAVGEWDMCRNGRYTEHGIKGLDGFARERWRADTDALIPIDQHLSEVGVLLEPATIVAKGWDEIDYISRRAYFPERCVVAITGAGPIGLLAALLGEQRGHEVHVFDIVEEGPKPALVHDLGASYHSDSLASSGLKPDVVIECTGVPSVVLQTIGTNGPGAIVCLAGVSEVGHSQPVDVGALNRNAVLENDVVFGTVNANTHHYRTAAQALAESDKSWLQRLITRRVPLSDFEEAFEHRAEDVKVVLDVKA